MGSVRLVAIAIEESRGRTEMWALDDQGRLWRRIRDSMDWSDWGRGVCPVEPPTPEGS